MRKLFLIPAAGFLITCPTWGMAAALAPDWQVTVELLACGLIQAGLVFGFTVAALENWRR